MSTVVTSVKYDICSEGCRLKNRGGSTAPPHPLSLVWPLLGPPCADVWTEPRRELKKNMSLLRCSH